MSIILYNASKIKSYENLKAMFVAIGEEETLADKLWSEMLTDEELLDEFNYFVANGTLKGTVKCGEFTLLDLYFSQMNKYNIYHDMGKNTDICNKNRMIINSFFQMLEMRKNPNYLVDFEKREDSGMDKM